MRVIGLFAMVASMLVVGVGVIVLIATNNGQTVINQDALGWILIFGGGGWVLVYLYCMDHRRDRERELIAFARRKLEEAADEGIHL